MLLTEVIRNFFSKPPKPVDDFALVSGPTASVLNVGGGNKMISIPQHYLNWQHLLLDIDPASGADIILDARKLGGLQSGQFDAVYCSHNLEHYFQHEVKTVLAGFSHVLKPDGFAEIHVPNMRGVLKRFIDTGMGINDILYESPGGPISVHDVIYGWGAQIEHTGVDFYAHKTGFTSETLMTILNNAGFADVWLAESEDTFALSALAFKQVPTAKQLAVLGLANQ